MWCCYTTATRLGWFSAQSVTLTQKSVCNTGDYSCLHAVFSKGDALLTYTHSSLQQTYPCYKSRSENSTQLIFLFRYKDLLSYSCCFSCEKLWQSHISTSIKQKSTVLCPIKPFRNPQDELNNRWYFFKFLESWKMQTGCHKINMYDLEVWYVSCELNVQIFQKQACRSCHFPFLQINNQSIWFDLIWFKGS